MIRTIVRSTTALLLAWFAFASVGGSRPNVVAAEPVVQGWKELPAEDLAKVPAQVAAFSKDGKTLAIASKNAVSLWDATTGTRRADFMLPESRKIPLTLSFSPDAKMLAVSSAVKGMQGEYVDVLSVSEESMIKKLTLRTSLEHYLVGFFAPNGKTLHIVSTGKGRLQVATFCTWSVDTGKVTTTKLQVAQKVATLGTRPGQELPNTWIPRQDSFTLHHGGNLFGIANGTNLELLDLAKGYTLFSAFGSMGAKNVPYTCCAFVPGQELPICGMGGYTGEVSLVGQPHEAMPSRDPMFPPSVFVTRLSGDTKAHPPRSIKGRQRNSVMSVAFTPDGTTLLSFAEDGKLCRHDCAPILKKVPIKANAKGALVIRDNEFGPLRLIDSVPLAKAPLFATFAADGSKLVVIEEVDKQPRVRVWVRDNAKE